MKLQTKHTQKGLKNEKPLIRYFDSSWLTYTKILRTPEGIASGLCQSGLASRLRSDKNDTLEKVLKPKKKHKVPDPVAKETVKIRGTFSIPEVFKNHLIKKDVFIDADEYEKIKHDEGLINQHFIHAISDRIEVRCERV